MMHILCICFGIQKPVYVHVQREDVSWFTENETDLLNELCRILCDNISLIQHRFQQQIESSSSNQSQEQLHHIQGDSIFITYTTRSNSKQYDNILQYKSDAVNSVPITTSISSFCLNPLYIRPLAQDAVVQSTSAKVISEDTASGDGRDEDKNTTGTATTVSNSPRPITSFFPNNSTTS
jgi:hypothetical protein